MIQAIKRFFAKHFDALNNEATAMNERQALANSVKAFLLGLFRFIIIVGV